MDLTGQTSKTLPQLPQSVDLISRGYEIFEFFHERGKEPERVLEASQRYLSLIKEFIASDQLPEEKRSNWEYAEHAWVFVQGLIIDPANSQEAFKNDLFELLNEEIADRPKIDKALMYLVCHREHEAGLVLEGLYEEDFRSPLTTFIKSLLDGHPHTSIIQPREVSGDYQRMTQDDLLEHPLCCYAIATGLQRGTTRLDNLEMFLDLPEHVNWLCESLRNLAEGTPPPQPLTPGLESYSLASMIATRLSNAIASRDLTTAFATLFETPCPLWVSAHLLDLVAVLFVELLEERAVALRRLATSLVASSFISALKYVAVGAVPILSGDDLQGGGYGDEMEGDTMGNAAGDEYSEGSYRGDMMAPTVSFQGTTGFGGMRAGASGLGIHVNKTTLLVQRLKEAKGVVDIELDEATTANALRVASRYKYAREWLRCIGIYKSIDLGVDESEIPAWTTEGLLSLYHGAKLIRKIRIQEDTLLESFIRPDGNRFDVGIIDELSREFDEEDLPKLKDLLSYTTKTPRHHFRLLISSILSRLENRTGDKVVPVTVEERAIEAIEELIAKQKSRTDLNDKMKLN